MLKATLQGWCSVKQPCVYMLASRPNGTLYVGVTSQLLQRVFQHRTGSVAGFTHRCGVKMLVWFEMHDNMENAIGREKAIKKWRRQWKVALIEQTNSSWVDLFEDLL
jgi:putative endonuclease